MAGDDDADQHLVVRFTEQQIAMLEQFCARHAGNPTLEELVADLFRQYADKALEEGNINR